jgi:hypothetical protein
MADSYMTKSHEPKLQLTNVDNDQLYECPMGINDDQHINNQCLVGQPPPITNSNNRPKKFRNFFGLLKFHVALFSKM